MSDIERVLANQLADLFDEAVTVDAGFHKYAPDDWWTEQAAKLLAALEAADCTIVRKGLVEAAEAVIGGAWRRETRPDIAYVNHIDLDALRAALEEPVP